MRGDDSDFALDCELYELTVWCPKTQLACPSPMLLHLLCLGMCQAFQGLLEIVLFGLVIVWLSCGWLLKPVHPIPNVSANMMGYINASCFKIMGRVYVQIEVWVEFNVQHKYMLLLYVLSQTIYVLLAYFDLGGFFFKLESNCQ